MDIVAYTVPVVAHAGDVVEVKVSTTRPRFRARLERLAPRGESVPLAGLRDDELVGREQPLRSGSHMLAHLPRELPGKGDATLQFWLRSSRLAAARQCVASVAGDGGAWELRLHAGALRLVRMSSDAEELDATPGIALAENEWYFVAASWSGDGSQCMLQCTEARFGPASRPPQIATREGTPIDPVRPNRVVLAASDVAGVPTDHFNGRIDSPRLFARRLTANESEALALGAPARAVSDLACEWLLVQATEGIRPTVPDRGALGAHGRLVNLPMVAVTGHGWDGRAMSQLEVPEQYNAAHFHDDDLVDCEWASDVSFEVPGDWASGVYAVALDAGDVRDDVPFIVSATGRVAPGTSSPIAVLLPTFSYLAYANEHTSWENPIPSSDSITQVVTEADRFVARHRLLSLYEVHSDGSGSCYSSWRRPVLNLRDGYHLPLVAGPHQFSADMELLRFLDSNGVDYDVITDDDLHRRGAGALVGYQAIVTGSHPEYWSAAMLDGLDTYLGVGGRLAYLGGNGLYWVTSTPARTTELIEVRRGRAGTRVWESEAGEEHHATTGERGGLWRNRGWAPQRLTGVGFTAQGFDKALPYEWTIDSSHPVAGFICRGIDTAAPLGDAGSVLGGAAGFEIDRMDELQGTPPGTVLVARAVGFGDGYQGTVEDVKTADSRQGGSVSELVRADVVFFVHPGGGAVFSVGSISWCGALSADGGVSPVGQATLNVLERFASSEPFA